MTRSPRHTDYLPCAGSLVLKFNGKATRYRLYPASLWGGPGDKFRLRRQRSFVGGTRQLSNMAFYSLQDAFNLIAEQQ